MNVILASYYITFFLQQRISSILTTADQNVEFQIPVLHGNFYNTTPTLKAQRPLQKRQQKVVRDRIS